MPDELDDIEINIYALVGWVGLIMMGSILAYQLLRGLPGLPGLGFPGPALAIAAAILLVFSACVFTSSGPLMIARSKRIDTPSNGAEAD